MNITLGFVNILVTFSLVVLIEKLFKKEGERKNGKREY